MQGGAVGCLEGFDGLDTSCKGLLGFEWWLNHFGFTYLLDVERRLADCSQLRSEVALNEVSLQVAC